MTTNTSSIARPVAAAIEVLPNGEDYIHIRDGNGREILGLGFGTHIPESRADEVAQCINAYPQLVAGVHAAIDRLYRWHCKGVQGTDHGLCPVDDDCEQCSTIRGLQAAMGGTNEPH